jgi:Ca2+-binding EF-hand superfamily protein
MHTTLLRPLVLGLMTVVLLVAQGPAQVPSGAKRGGFGDPGQLFDRFSGGKNVWIRTDITDPRRQMFFDRVAQSLGITNGQITREQFSTAMQQMRSSPGGKGSTNNGPSQASPPAVSQPAAAATGQPLSFDQDAEQQFKRRDRNGDGFLNADEMSGKLKAELARWDRNKDGLIDLNEYKAYLKDRMLQRALTVPGQSGAAANIEPEEAPRPEVYRAGHLPKGLPAWFTELDTDKDGQVALYEWHKAGKSVPEFEAMDRNSDGFLTVEELLYYQAALAKKGESTPAPQVTSLANSKSTPGVSATKGPSRFRGAPPGTGDSTSGDMNGKKGRFSGKWKKGPG